MALGPGGFRRLRRDPVWFDARQREHAIAAIEAALREHARLYGTLNVRAVTVYFSMRQELVREVPDRVRDAFRRAGWSGVELDLSEVREGSVVYQITLCVPVKRRQKRKETRGRRVAA